MRLHGLLLFAGGALLAIAPVGDAPASVGAARADLELTLADTPDPARPSPGVRYRVSLTNVGPDRARRVAVRLHTSARRAIVGVPSGCGADRLGARCVRDGLLPQRTWRLTFRVAPCRAGTVSATATASSRTPDPRPADNVARATTTIVPGPPPPPPPGGSGGCSGR
jgi:Domain of unknown function DUF11